jgi:hypothetical protein
MPLDPEVDGEPQFGMTDMKIIPIYPDNAFIDELIKRAGEMIRRLETETPPEPTIFLESTPFQVTYPKAKVPGGGYWAPGMVPAI